MLAGLLIGGCRSQVQKKEAVAKTMNEVVLLGAASGTPQSAPAENDPLRDQFYFKTPILGLNLGMTLSELDALMTKNGKVLGKPQDYNSDDAPGFSVFDMNPQLFTSSKINPRGDHNIFTKLNNPYGILVYELDKTQCPVPVDSVIRIELAFIGGRLISISPYDDSREDFIYNTLRGKYEVIKDYGVSEDEIKRGFKPNLSLIKVDDKECAISTMYYGSAIVNMPYAKALLKDIEKRINENQRLEERARTEAAKGI